MNCVPGGWAGSGFCFGRVGLGWSWTLLNHLIQWLQPGWFGLKQVAPEALPDRWSSEWIPGLGQPRGSPPGLAGGQPDSTGRTDWLRPWFYGRTRCPLGCESAGWPGSGSSGSVASFVWLCSTWWILSQSAVSCSPCHLVEPWFSCSETLDVPSTALITTFLAYSACFCFQFCRTSCQSAILHSSVVRSPLPCLTGDLRALQQLFAGRWAVTSSTATLSWRLPGAGLHRRKFHSWFHVDPLDKQH